MAADTQGVIGSRVPAEVEDHPAANGPSGYFGLERAFANARILVVDDVAMNVALLEQMLSSAGVTHVRGETDPGRVVEACLDFQPDLVLLDLHMPGRDGLAVLDDVRSALPPDLFLPVVMLTADMSVTSRERALAAGVHDFLTKPFDRTEVLLRIRNLLETRRLALSVEAHNEELRIALETQLSRERAWATDRREKLDRVRSALWGKTVTARYQPIVRLDRGQVVGAEALAHFEGDPRRPPDVWFAEALDVSLGTELELAALDAALGGLDSLARGVFLAVNVSAATVTVPQLARQLDHVPGERLVLELAEHHRIDDYDAVWPAIEALRERGVRLAVDDARVGYTGLQHILRLKPDIVKLDLELTRGVDADPARRALTAAMVRFAGDIGAMLIAEGIETDEELVALRELGIHYGQGHRFGLPGPLPLPRSVDLPDPPGPSS